MGAKIFMGFTILDVVVAFFAGTVDADTESIIFNLVIIFACVAANLIFSKTKFATWLRYLLAYMSVLLIMLAYFAIVGASGVVATYVNVVIFVTAIFIIIEIVDRIGNHVKKKDGRAEPTDT